MDWKSHGLIGILIAIILGLTDWINIIALVLGLMLPDLSVILFIFYFGFNKQKVLSAFTNNKENPKSLFMIYNSLHSILLIIIMGLLGYFFAPLYYLAFGMLIHIFIDIPLHKDHPVKSFYPLRWTLNKNVNWWDYYGKDLKSRVIVWALLIILIIIAVIVRYYL